MNFSNEHQKYRKIPYSLDFISTTCFSEEEKNILTEYGSWMEALTKKLIEPTSSAQEQFIRVFKGEIDPNTKFEKVWMKLQARIEFETNNAPHSSLGSAIQQAWKAADASRDDWWSKER